MPAFRIRDNDTHPHLDALLRRRLDLDDSPSDPHTGLTAPAERMLPHRV
jgi:hypothetical protein